MVNGRTEQGKFCVSSVHLISLVTLSIFFFYMVSYIIKSKCKKDHINFLSTPVLVIPSLYNRISAFLLQTFTNSSWGFASPVRPGSLTIAICLMNIILVTAHKVEQSLCWSFPLRLQPHCHMPTTARLVGEPAVLWKPFRCVSSVLCPSKKVLPLNIKLPFSKTQTCPNGFHLTFVLQLSAHRGERGSSCHLSGCGSHTAPMLTLPASCDCLEHPRTSHVALNNFIDLQYTSMKYISCF